eukprot:s2244_g5.t1
MIHVGLQLRRRMASRASLPSLEALNEAAELGDVQKAEAIFSVLFPSMPQNKHTMTCNTLMKAYANRGLGQKAAEWHNKMCSQRIRTNAKTYGKVIEAFAKSGDLENALAYLARMSQFFPPDKINFNTVIAAAAQAGLVPETEALVLGLTQQRIEPSLESYGSLLNAYAKGSNAAAAIEVLQGMGHLQVTPNQVCFSAAMDACGRAARPEDAIDILHRMQNQTIAPDVVALSSIVNAFSQLGKAADAAKWLEQAEEIGLSPNIITYNCVIHACARVGHPRKAIRWLERLRAAQLQPDVKGRPLADAQHWFNRLAAQHMPDLGAFVSVIFICARSGRLWEASEWLRRMRESGLQLDSGPYNGVIAAAAQAKEPDWALRCLQDMLETSVQPNIMTHTNIINAFAKVFHHRAAIEWLDVMEDAHGITPNVLSFTCAIEACLWASEWGEALRLLQRMRQRGVRADSVLMRKLNRQVGSEAPPLVLVP